MRPIVFTVLSVTGIAALALAMFLVLAALLKPEEPEVWEFDPSHSFPRQESGQEDWRFEM